MSVYLKSEETAFERQNKILGTCKYFKSSNLFPSLREGLREESES